MSYRYHHNPVSVLAYLNYPVPSELAITDKVNVKHLNEVKIQIKQNSVYLYNTGKFKLLKSACIIKNRILFCSAAISNICKILELLLKIL